MADFDSTSYVQRRNLNALEFFFKIDILLRIFGKKVYPGKWHIPGYPNIGSTLPGQETQPDSQTIEDDYHYQIKMRLTDSIQYRKQSSKPYQNQKDFWMNTLPYFPI